MVSINESGTVMKPMHSQIYYALMTVTHGVVAVVVKNNLGLVDILELFPSPPVAMHLMHGSNKLF